MISKIKKLVKNYLSNADRGDNLIEEIKKIVRNYLNNADLCKMIVGTVETNGIRISEKIVIPNDLIFGNLKNTIATGDNVRLLKNYGGGQYYILEVVE